MDTDAGASLLKAFLDGGKDSGVCCLPSPNCPLQVCLSKANSSYIKASLLI